MNKILFFLQEKILFSRFFNFKFLSDSLFKRFARKMRNLNIILQA